MAVITSAFNCEFKIQVASRTYKKIHSYDQKVKLSFNIVLEPKQLQWILNNKLPNDIYITNCCIVANDFHVRKKCVLKTYIIIRLIVGLTMSFNKDVFINITNRYEKEIYKRLLKFLLELMNFLIFLYLKDNETISRVRNIKSIKIKKHQDLVIIIIKARSFIRSSSKNDCW